METGEKIISSVYIDEKSKSPEKLSTICYIESMLAQFMKTMSISNVKPCFIQTQFSLAESHFLYPSTKTADELVVVDEIARWSTGCPTFNK